MEDINHNLDQPQLTVETSDVENSNSLRQETLPTLEELKERVEEIASQTREGLESLVYDLYNLLFTESQKSSISSQLYDQIACYDKFSKRLETVRGDTWTQGTLQQFAEVNRRLQSKLDQTRLKLQREAPSQNEMPYLDESRKAEAAGILADYRRRIRSETAECQALVAELSNAVIEFHQPLQTLWTGASVADIDNPTRNEQHQPLLAQIKAVFAEAGIEMYHPQEGETLDVARANYDFVGERHPAPFLVMQVEKLGLRVNDFIEKGEVLVA